MHELSIADAVREIVERNARGRRVVSVELKVGHLRQVVPDSLGFAWQLVTEGTALDGAGLKTDYVAASAHCGACGSDTELTAFPALCQACGSLDVEVSGGDELLVEALVLEENEALAGTGG
jgi:hydrogenase nickel incorporation protein HypA/HybF